MAAYTKARADLVAIFATGIPGSVIGAPFGVGTYQGGKVIAEIAIHKFISICDGALVFHTKMRSFNKLVSVFIKRIRTKPVLKAFHHFCSLCILLFCFLFIFL